VDGESRSTRLLSLRTTESVVRARETVVRAATWRL